MDADLETIKIFSEFKSNHQLSILELNIYSLHLSPRKVLETSLCSPQCSIDTLSGTNEY